jgi:cholestenol delta-isomerase
LRVGAEKSDEYMANIYHNVGGFIHTFFEGDFVLHHTAMAHRQDLFGQLWKEYAFSDSRYLTSDPFVLCMEAITAIFWGPLSFAVVYFIAVDSPFRHPFQLIVSHGQLYGDVLYYATSLFDHYYKGVSYSRPDSYYYWAYYVFMNTFWIVIPLWLIYQSVVVIKKSVIALGKVEQTLKKKNGSALTTKKTS